MSTETVVEDFDYSKVRPCPFCGDTGALRKSEVPGRRPLYCVGCMQEGCALFVFTRHCGSPDEAVRLWNQRA